MGVYIWIRGRKGKAKKERETSRIHSGVEKVENGSIERVEKKLGRVGIWHSLEGAEDESGALVYSPILHSSHSDPWHSKHVECVCVCVRERGKGVEASLVV